MLDVLVASFWQGALVATAVAVVLAFTGRGLNAATRSIVLQGALLAIALVPLLTTLPSVLPNASNAAGDIGAAANVARNAGPADGVPAAGPRRIDVSLSDSAVFRRSSNRAAMRPTIARCSPCSGSAWHRAASRPPGRKPRC